MKYIRTTVPKYKYHAVLVALFLLLVSLAIMLLKQAYNRSNAIISPLANGHVVYAKEYYCPEPTPTPKIVKASWYGISDSECLGCSVSRRTASGEIFDENAMTGACSYNYKLGDMVTLRYNDNIITFKCTDRGGFAKYNREFDLSKGAFEKLAPLSRGIISVEIL